jgi:hypothetical protein
VINAFSKIKNQRPKTYMQMKNKIFRIFFMGLMLSTCFLHAHAQQKGDKNPVPTGLPKMKRTETKTESMPMGAGGTVTIVGAPSGSIKVESWSKMAVEVTAEIEIQANTEEELAWLAKANGFKWEENLNSLSVLTVGTHDRQYMKKAFKKSFPKNLLDMPWRIDYRVKVPKYCDLEINMGKGDFDLSGVDGYIFVKALETRNANLDLVGGEVSATFANGNVNVKLNSRSWRGREVKVQVATGNLNVQIPAMYNADVNADILRTGQIENSYAAFQPRERTKFTEKSMQARTGNGGAVISFTVGDGTIKILPQN